MSGTAVGISHRALDLVLGRWGMEELVEPRVRRLVLAHLGVDAGAVDALAWRRNHAGRHAAVVLALGALVESEFGIDLPERLLDQIDSYRALVDVVVGRLLARRDADRATAGGVVRISAVVRSPSGAIAGMVRAGPLTSYLAETIMADAHLQREHACLDVRVAGDASESDLVTVRRHFVRMTARGTRLDLRRTGVETTAGASNVLLQAS